MNTKWLKKNNTLNDELIKSYFEHNAKIKIKNDYKASTLSLSNKFASAISLMCKLMKLMMILFRIIINEGRKKIVVQWSLKYINNYLFYHIHDSLYTGSLCLIWVKYINKFLHYCLHVTNFFL